MLPNNTYSNKYLFHDHLESSQDFHMTSTSRAKYGKCGKHVWEREKQSRHTKKRYCLLSLKGKAIERVLLNVYTKKYPEMSRETWRLMLEIKLGKELSLGKMLIWVQLTCRSSCVPFWPSDLSLFPPLPGYALPLWTTIPELTTGRLYLGCGLNLKETDKEIHILIFHLHYRSKCCIYLIKMQ